jgi:hypothetical protein
MALESKDAAAICWAERATRPEARNFAAFKWDESSGQRVPSTNEAGVQLRDRRPLQAHRGNNLTGVSVAADIKSTMKVLRQDGITADVKVSNGPAHEAGEDDRYALYQRSKGRALGWIPYGECPAAMVAHGIVEAHLVIAEAAKDGKPCPRSDLGFQRKPCPHFWAELHAREAAAKARSAVREAAALSEGDKILASNAQAMASQAKATTEILSRVSETQAQLLAITAASRQPDKPEKGGR